jgi:hypothetical protein
VRHRTHRASSPLITLQLSQSLGSEMHRYISHEPPDCALRGNPQNCQFAVNGLKSETRANPIEAMKPRGGAAAFLDLEDRRHRRMIGRLLAFALVAVNSAFGACVTHGG